MPEKEPSFTTSLYDMAQRLLGCMQLGILLQGENGHIWIESIEGSDFEDLLKANKISLNNKIYGGILEALDTIDECLTKHCQHCCLKDCYNPDVQFLGSGGPAHDRIYTNSCVGGLV